MKLESVWIRQIVILVVAINVGVVGVILILKETSFPPTYSEFIVGNIAWTASTKFQDLLAPVAFIFIVVGILWAMGSFNLNLKRSHREGPNSPFIQHLVFWFIPALIGVGSMFMGLPFLPELYYFSFIGLTLFITCSWLVHKRTGTLIAEDVSLYIIFGWLIAILPIEILTLITRLNIIEGRVIFQIFPIIEDFAIVWFLFLIAGSYLFANKISNLLPKLILLGQAGLPLFLLVLYPQTLATPEGNVSYPSGIGLAWVIGLLCLWSYRDIWVRFKRNSIGIGNSFYLSPIALFGLLLVMKIGYTPIPIIYQDDYHFGERLLGWWSWMYHGKRPYLDYITAHGLIGDDFAGIISALIFDGSAGVIHVSQKLALAFVMLGAYLALYRCTQSILLAFISILLFGPEDNILLLFLAAFFCLYCSEENTKSPAKWILVWLASLPFVVLGVPPQGILLIAATTPTALWFIWQACSKEKYKLGKYISMIAISFIVLSLVVPIPKILFEIVRYVFENGPINQLAYGIAWSASWGTQGNLGIGFELLRMSWVAAPILALIVIGLFYKKSNEWQLVITVALPILIFTLLLIPYSMGRIDPGGLSRAGRVSILIWTIFIPLLLWPLLKNTGRTLVLVVISFVGGCLGFSAQALWLNHSLLRPTIQVGSLQNGEKIGLPNIGFGLMNPAHKEHLKNLKNTMDMFLRPEEHYLDLTNRNAHHFYLNRPSSLQISAAYNMAPIQSQQRAVEMLRARPPRVALLDLHGEINNQLHDGGKISLRAPVLYRFVLDNYEPVLVNGLTLGFHRDALSSLNRIPLAIKDFSDLNWQRGFHRRNTGFMVNDSLALYWVAIGDRVRNMDGVIRRITRIDKGLNEVWVDGPLFESPEAEVVLDLDSFTPITHDLVKRENEFSVTGIDPFLAIAFPNIRLSGDQAGMLRFDFICKGQRSNPRLQVFWWGDEQGGPFEEASLVMDGASGTLIAPLDAYPGWVKLERVKGIRLDLASPQACQSIQFKNIQLIENQRHPTLSFVEVDLDLTKKMKMANTLLNRAFMVKDLKKIPIAWGTSISSLSKRMESVIGLDSYPLSTHHLTEEQGHLSINGNDPYVIIDFSDVGLSGNQAGLLRFDFTCKEQRSNPRLQVFWWGDEQGGPFEEASLVMDGASGTLIVPLDAYPGWVKLDRVKGIRLDLASPQACQSIQFENIGLYQRKALLK